MLTPLELTDPVAKVKALPEADVTGVKDRITGQTLDSDAVTHINSKF